MTWPVRRTLARVLFDWRFDLIYGTAAVVFAAVYVAGVIRLRRRGDAWPTGRIVAWLCGCAVLLIATSSGIGRYMPAMFSMHMAAHMLLSMLAPVLLVLGAPVTLALRALPAAGRDDPPGLREWLLAALHSRVSRFLTNPIVATMLFVAGFYGLYFGGIFDLAAGSHAAHLAMNLHFLLTGYLFYWVVIGVDPDAAAHPAAGQAGDGVRVAAPARVLRGRADGHKTVLAGSFYESLKLYWHTDLLGDQRLGGGIAWSAGEVPLVLVLIALLVQWRRSDRRTATRLDRAADRDDDADLAAYNRMLAEWRAASRIRADRFPTPNVTSRREIGKYSPQCHVPRADPTDGASRRRPPPRQRPSLPYWLMSVPAAAAAPSHPNEVRHVPSSNSTLPSCIGAGRAARNRPSAAGRAATGAPSAPCPRRWGTG